MFSHVSVRQLFCPQVSQDACDVPTSRSHGRGQLPDPDIRPGIG